MSILQAITQRYLQEKPMSNLPPDQMTAHSGQIVPDTPVPGATTAWPADQSEPLLQFFEWDHLPAHLQVTSGWFQDLAIDIINSVPRNPERTVALRKLLEAKDCAVRALIYK